MFISSLEATLLFWVISWYPVLKIKPLSVLILSDESEMQQWNMISTKGRYISDSEQAYFGKYLMKYLENI